MPSWSNFYSFEKAIKVICKTIEVKNAVEWGPGLSTELLLRNSNANIHAWENFSSYSDYYTKKYVEEDRVNIYYGDIVGGRGSKTPYVAGPFSVFGIGEVDLCFIDGRFRADCILIAYHLINPNGLVVVHDIKRHAYQKAKKIFPFEFEDMPAGDGVGIYGKNEEIIKKVTELYAKTPVTHDWQEITGKKDS